MKTKLLARILAILGFGSGLSACMYGVPSEMYGTPYQSFSARGEVTNEAGEPIKGIRVSVVNQGETFTDQTGEYSIQGDAVEQTILLEFDDIDGAENGGEFASTTASVGERSNEVPTIVMTLKE